MYSNLKPAEDNNEQIEGGEAVIDFQSHDNYN